MEFIRERVRKTALDLRNFLYATKIPCTEIKMKRGNYHSPLEVDASPEVWQTFERADGWGGFDAHAWFRFHVTVPEQMEGKPVFLLLGTAPLEWSGWDATNPQFVVLVDGVVRQGVDTNHQEVLLTEKAVAGTIWQVDLHAYGGRVMAKGESLRLSVDFACMDRDIEQLYYDLWVPVEALPLMSEEAPSRHAVLNVLNEAVNLLDWRDAPGDSFHQSVREAIRYLKKSLYDDLCGYDEVQATCVGHTHIDVAWHWTVAQTREKVVRSFSTVLALMEQYPEYKFMSSQPQLYEFLQEDHPELLERIKERVSEGRWEAEGGMWLEADCNVTSGESLVRQLLYGKAFFQDTFGVDNRILWLPDVFGYSAALPQILKKSGIDWFMTTKIAWNQFNKLPYDTFNWRGVDGTEVLTYFITTTDRPDKNFTTYNGDTNPASVKGTWSRYQQKEINQDVMISFGHGDGGGGPTRGMLESARRLSKGLPGIPKTQMGTAGEFFDRLEKKVKDHPRLPTWVGELYLEYHRGTYTSMARNKRYNRKNEILWGEVELLHVLAGLTGTSWPKARLDAAWKKLLLNQFHDILPGTSIWDVYEVCQEEYEQLLSDGQEMAAHAMGCLAEKAAGNSPALMVVNTLSFERSDLVETTVPDNIRHPAVLTGGGWQEGQRVQTPEGERVLFHVPEVPPMGFKTFALGEKPVVTDIFESESQNAQWIVSPGLLENRFFTIRLDDAGHFISLYDKTCSREVLKNGEKGNVIQAFEDRPMNYDNWDIDMYYTEKSWVVDSLQNVTVTENGPVRGTLRLERKFCKSLITQDIHIYRDIPRVDFETHVDWQQSQILLKVAFPVEINTDKATYEIQFGHVERPTHWNTSWDWARFEVCAHRWADLSETGYGVSLLNDCKYGHDIKDGVMRLTLIKSGIEPNPVTDRGEHRFTYSLYPHQGSWREAGTLPMAARLNVSLRSMVLEPKMQYDPGVGEHSLVHSDKVHVVVETVKQAEDGQGIIVRLYESENRRGTVRLSFGRPLKQVHACNLMEQNEGVVSFAEHTVDLVVRPLDIQTLRVQFAD